MRILCAIVEPTAGLVLLDSKTDLVRRRQIRPKPIGDDAARSPVFLHDPLEATASKTSPMIDRAPKIAELAVDFG